MKASEKNGSMLFGFLQGSWRWIITAVILGVFQAVFSMLNPKIVQYTVDSIIDYDANDPSGISGKLLKLCGGAEYLRSHLWIVAVAVVCLAVLSALCKYGFTYFSAKGGETFVRTMRNRTFTHIQHLPFSWHMTHQTGDIIQRCTTDIDIIKNFVTEQMLSLFNCGITLIAAIVFMFGVNARLALLILLLQPILAFFVIYFRGSIEKSFRKCDENEGVLSGIALENLTGVRVVRAFGREAYERDRFDRQSRNVRDLWVKLGTDLTMFWEGVTVLSCAQNLIVLAVGTAMVVHGSLTLGSLLAMISYASLASQPIRMLGHIISEMSKAGVSISRIREIMDAEEERDKPGAGEPPMTGDIEFHHVTFAYPNCPPVLQDVDLKIPAGTTLGILGGTGSGKSTLVYLLGRLYELPAENGSITIGGVDIADMKAEWVRKNIGIVLQEPMLFSRTLYENIAMGGENVTEEEVHMASGIACLEHSVQSFAHGYDTIVGERGVTLSGGQKQRAAIARMLLQDAPVMVFDDSLSAVDAETDSKIRDALRTHKRESTRILIAHRISTLMEADQIIVLEHGHISQRGTHEELIAQEGLYRRIYELQCSCEEEAEQDA